MNKKFLTLGLASLVSASCFSQIKPLTPNKDAIKFSKAINPENAYKHLSVLASDAYEGRETGTKGAWMAADYIRDYFKSLGLKAPVNGSYFQKIDLVNVTLKESQVTVNGQPKEYQKDYLVSPSLISDQGFTFSTNELVFVGYGIKKDSYNDFAGTDIKEKVVIMFNGGDPTVKPGTRIDRAAYRATLDARAKYFAENNVKAILLIDPAVDRITENTKQTLKNGRVMVKTNAAIEAQKQNDIPRISVSVALANDLLKASNTTVADLQKKIVDSQAPASQVLNVPFSASAAKTETPVRCENVLGYLEGSDPVLKKEVLILTGHYDHIGLETDPNAKDKVNNGADDDGSGTTGVLLMAKAFTDAKKAGKGSKRSILFMTVVGEEKGLWGSEWYSEHPVFPVENTIADLNTDMIGRTGEEYLGTPDSANYIYSVGSRMLSSDLANLSEQVNATYTKMKLDYKYDDPKDPEQIYYRSDHYNFAKLGIPIIFYYDGMLQQDYHKPGDEVSKINFPLLAKRAKLTYFTAWELANRAKRPAVDMDGKGNPKK
ncbi:M28 family peptidase [Pedobacter psychrodurus]|uniref:M28 family peptidase n=1 Tax=Pedobacter psychrodurus TaxID=2530456 RepID=A0A4R0Q4F6_9SPHI|nr:M28 family peptidase [Pedobacter psychrodurus]TCD27408.1 M28 family peptidase [Pedobacter psychrodurus]